MIFCEWCPVDKGQVNTFTDMEKINLKNFFFASLNDGEAKNYKRPF